MILKQTMPKENRGFTLIEVMVAVSIISLISSIIVTSISVAKAQGNDAATISQVHEIQNALFVETISNGRNMPNPGSAATYYCLGQSSAQTCNFWGLTGSSILHGNDIVKASLVSGGLAGVPSSAPVVIDGLLYQGYLYKCNAISSDNVCSAAIYWAQSKYTACTIGVEVYAGAGGRVCGQDAGAATTNNVDICIFRPPPGVSSCPVLP